MNHLSLSVSISTVASSIDGDGYNLAELFNELALRGPVSPTFQVEFAEALDEDGRGLLKQLLDAVVGHDAEGR